MVLLKLGQLLTWVQLFGEEGGGGGFQYQTQKQAVEIPQVLASTVVFFH